MTIADRLNITRRIRSWRYRRLARRAQVFAFEGPGLLSEGYFSQCGQDKWICERMYPGMRDGVFVDIGAHDGVSFSNTCFLERTLGWTGIAVEPMADIFERLDENRNCVKVNGCVSARDGKGVFRKVRGYSEMLSGLVDQYDPRHLNRLERELAIHGGSVEEIEVPCFRLNGLLESHGIRRVDYLSVDVEGAELDILRTIDFDAVQVGVCGIENNYKDYRIPALMKSKGFAFVAIVGDEFYVNSSLATGR